ncbi:hypothetical protein ACFSTC_53980 [Nonomuraea ferruginea]
MTKAERRVWNAFPTGEMVEFADVKPGSTRTAGVNAPKDGDTWGARAHRPGGSDREAAARRP